MSRRRFLGSAAALPLMASAAGAAGKAQRKPNLVWIWCDNLAYGDLSCYGNERIKTPVVDKMAEEGVRFMQHYVAHTVCSPSRAALLTGRQPFRVGIVDVLRPDCPAGIPDDEITLGDALGAEGYATAAFGKWHLGDRRESLPLQHGFDHYYGLRDGCCNYWNPGEKREDEPEPGRKRIRYWCDDEKTYYPFTPPNRDFYTTDAFTDKALNWS